MIRRLLSFVAWAVALAAPSLAWADRNPENNDPRMEALPKDVLLSDPGSTALTWMLLIFLTLIAIAVLFKNARRTHLD